MRSATRFHWRRVRCDLPYPTLHAAKGAPFRWGGARARYRGSGHRDTSPCRTSPGRRGRQKEKGGFARPGAEARPTNSLPVLAEVSWIPRADLSHFSAFSRFIGNLQTRFLQIVGRVSRCLRYRQTGQSRRTTGVPHAASAPPACGVSRCHEQHGRRRTTSAYTNRGAPACVGCGGWWPMLRLPLYVSALRRITVRAPAEPCYALAPRNKPRARWLRFGVTSLSRHHQRPHVPPAPLGLCVPNCWPHRGSVAWNSRKTCWI